MPLSKADLTRLRSLQDKKHRDALGLFVVEGEKVVGELLAAKFPFAEIHATAAWSGARTNLVTDAEMGRLSHYPTPSSVLA
ncbi:MAG: RNA methyltransferase, partial [Oleiharenicola lentus]